MDLRSARRRRRRSEVRRLVRRSAAAALATQLATVGGLLVFDSLRRKDRPDQEFPHRPGAPVPVDGGDVRIYTFGEHLFEDMLADIEAATSRIYFETYIWKSDAVGRRFRQALVDAHERGVEVYVVFDTFANLVVPQEFYRGLPEGIHVKRHPLVTGGAKFFFPSHWGRNHRKLLVVDSTAAYVGGYNIGQDYANRWRDTHARFAGDMVVELEERLRRLLEPLRRHATAPPAGAAHVEPRDAGPPQPAGRHGLPDPQHVPRGDRPRQHPGLADDRLPHPRRRLRP
ncbi:phospholipase D-like domain-containing protein [Janibacter hoylei]|uniref:phospholipase D-like domain-containing protein n=1 Tax=Janibacter hoylei TaxID=364298 RepID=UPI002238E6E8|nr:phospholipase D-like domain-containing protein [Janibacter hoylei]MCW4602321.1 phospholipase D-like domain-containing protein [Janibacter hoylei]